MGPPVASGRGAARGRGRGAAQPQAEEEGSTRYERISLLAAELQGCATGGDGADSALFSEDGGGDSGDEQPRRTDPADPDDDDDDGDSYEDPAEANARDADGMSALESSDDEARAAKRSQKRQKKKDHRGSTSGPVSASEMMAAAAFGGRSRMFGDATSDDESQISRTSSKRKRDAYCKAFPVKGVTCVGCALANRIGPVERFVMANVGRQAEHALWKFASLTWKREVVEPARREGVHVVDWPWRDIANHFRLHTTSSVVGRTAMINTLTAMRCQVESVLVRNDNGERTLDKNNAELALKVSSIPSHSHAVILFTCFASVRRSWRPRVANASFCKPTALEAVAVALVAPRSQRGVKSEDPLKRHKSGAQSWHTRTMRRMDLLNVTDFSVHGLAAHAAKHATSLPVGVWVGLSLGTILTCCCLCMCFQCMCGKGITLSARPPVREYEGLPLITIKQMGRR